MVIHSVIVRMPQVVFKDVDQFFSIGSEPGDLTGNRRDVMIMVPWHYAT